MILMFFTDRVIIRIMWRSQWKASPVNWVAVVCHLSLGNRRRSLNDGVFVALGRSFL